MRKTLFEWLYGKTLWCLIEKTERGLLHWENANGIGYNAYQVLDGDIWFRVSVFNFIYDNEYTLKATKDNKVIFTQTWGARKLFKLVYNQEMAPIWAKNKELIDSYLNKEC
jgi:hypothetical protein